MNDDIGEFVRSLDAGRVWAALGLPGVHGRSCKCPKHSDSAASFSVYWSQRYGRWLWKCHAGCGHGDLVDLWVMMTGQTKGEALRDLRRAFGGPSGGHTTSFREWISAQPAVRPKPVLDMKSGSDAEFKALAELRRLPESALRLAAERGLLRFADHRGTRCWVITDSEGWAISCRPLGVNPWEGTKSLMVKNTHGAHLVGSPQLESAGLVFLCEGGPDLLAAHAILLHLNLLELIVLPRVVATAMLSASTSPGTATCEAFHGKTVVIWAHSDPEGIKAAVRWACQIRPYAIAVHVIQAGDLLPGVNDLNDLVAHVDGLGLVTEALERLMSQ